jgi:putative NADPH-quinone reductase
MTGQLHEPGTGAPRPRALFINGGPHKNGSTAGILRAIRAGLEPVSQADWVDVYDLAVKPCRGCLACRPDKRCVLPEDGGHLVGEKILAADIVVVGSPTYWGNMTGPLKTLLDRNVTVFEHFNNRFPEPACRGKKAVIVTTCAAPFPFNHFRTQGAGCIRAIMTVLDSGGFTLVGTINRPREPRAAAIPPAVLRKIGRICRALVAG